MRDCSGCCRRSRESDTALSSRSFGLGGQRSVGNCSAQEGLVSSTQGVRWGIGDGGWGGVPGFGEVMVACRGFQQKSLGVSFGFCLFLWVVKCTQHTT